MTEHELQNAIRVELSKYGVVFRTNAGAFWQGRRVYSKDLREWVLTDLHRVEGLPEGFSDLIFIDKSGIAFIEIKAASGRVSKAQKQFLSRMKDYGCRAGVARSVEEAIKIVQGENIP